MEVNARIRVAIPVDILERIDNLVGRRKRSSFITEAVKRELNRLTFLKTLKETSGAWKDENHPEFKQGNYKWIRKMRSESETRLSK